MRGPTCQRIKKLLAIPASFLFAHLTASPAFAKCDTPPTQTSLGPIPTCAGDLALWIMEKGIVLAAFGAAILIVMSGYQLMASSGDPLHIRAAKERLTAAIAGLLFILMIELILRTIWSDVFEMGPVS